MKRITKSCICALLIGAMLPFSVCGQTKSSPQGQMMVRLSEIEILPEFLTEYNAILKEEAAASVEKEPGVIAIFPMSIREQPTQIRIIEIYADSAAYQSHLKTPHFQHYKTTTLKMVKALKLVDMTALDKQTMSEIFKKLKQ
ncbi:putative quinol monooxygenase [Dyadobacter bucti]|uniref:putative quinol monooxygenase n=1 Tax=Dyadobacter bucti TaxID=2572203 RepID=UPI001407D8C5|nr:antibiotic biosynthesis monooxygenase family protein [Dyadobacter bucti]